MLRTRPATSGDLDFLWSMLYYAAHADEQAEATVWSIRLDPGLERYLCDWGRTGDYGVVVTEGETPIGAAWLRLFTPDETELVTYVDPEIPELAIAVDRQPGRNDIGQDDQTAAPVASVRRRC
jgi:hypothetical protein